MTKAAPLEDLSPPPPAPFVHVPEWVTTPAPTPNPQAWAHDMNIAHSPNLDTTKPKARNKK
jgi:hypothetical protein